MENRQVCYDKHEYERWTKRKNEVRRIVEEQWKKWIKTFGYDENINICEMAWHHYEFVCIEIDRILEPYFTGADALYIRNGWLPGWRYKARHLRKTNETQSQ